MKNIINEKPSNDLYGRLRFSSNFVHDADIKDKEILDIGCGYGWFEINAVKKGVKSIIGIDMTNEDISTALKYVDYDNVSFRVGSAIELPFEDSVFDTVVSWEVLEHIPKSTEKQMFSEVYRVLKPGGCFYLSTPYRNFFSNLFDPAYWLIGHRHYSKKKVSDFADQAGFSVKNIALRGGIWEIISINNLYIAKWIFRRKPFFEEYIQKKLNEEYAMERGITNIFMEIKKTI
jgi:ubiquinone/menaquinone biosynthesis C-methylase UbiE